MLDKVASAVLVVPPACWRRRRAMPRSVDLSTLRCKQFIELPKEPLNAITLWLDGYLTDEEESAVIDFDKMKARPRGWRHIARRIRR